MTLPIKNHSLGEAAKAVGLAPSTLTKAANKGRLNYHIDSNGNRSFNTLDLGAWQGYDRLFQFLDDSTDKLKPPSSQVDTVLRLENSQLGSQLSCAMSQAEQLTNQVTALRMLVQKLTAERDHHKARAEAFKNALETSV